MRQRPLLVPALVLYLGLGLGVSDAVPSDVPAPAVGANTPPPPVGPLPDALLDGAACSSSGGGNGGACDVPSATPTGRYYCSHSHVNRHYDQFGSLQCYDDNPYRTSIGDFVTPDLSEGDTVPMAWRNGGKLVGEYAAQIGLPDALGSSLLSLYYEIEPELSVSSKPADGDDDGRFISTANDQLWYAETSGCAELISPGNEATHEAFLERLSSGNLDSTLEAVAKTYELHTLAAYQVSFARSANCSSVEVLESQPETEGYAYKLVVPLSLQMAASMVIMDDGKEPDWHLSRGTYPYQSSVGALIGDGVQHSIFDVGSAGLVAIVHLAEIDEENAPIIGGMIDSAFPLHIEWLDSQIGRHYDHENEKATMSKGRKRFHVSDGDDCPDESSVDEQCRYIQVRVECPVSCDVYLQTQRTKNRQIELFFASLPYDDECVDESDECSDSAASGMCMTEMEKMLEYGCHWSCLYCQVPSSVELFSLGKDQVFEHDDDEGLVTRVPSHEEIQERIDQTVSHMIDTVLVQDDHKAYRISCQNNEPQCSYWAASGWCETFVGWMGQNCPAACFSCPLADITKRCPVDKKTNVFQPGDMNQMYERWLSEAGVDVSTLSPDNPPPTSVDHPFGKLRVVSSPYHDMTRLLKDDDDEDDDSPSGGWNRRRAWRSRSA